MTLGSVINACAEAADIEKAEMWLEAIGLRSSLTAPWSGSKSWGATEAPEVGGPPVDCRLSRGTVQGVIPKDLPLQLVLVWLPLSS